MFDVNDLHSPVSFGGAGGGGGGGGGSKPGPATTAAACVAAVGGTLSAFGAARSGNVMGAVGSLSTASAAFSVCARGLRSGPQDTGNWSQNPANYGP